MQQQQDSTKIKVIRLLAFVIVPVAFVTLLAVGLLKKAPDRDLVGKPAPAFDLPLLEGGRLSSRELQGHPVIVNFWASWCGPCIEEAPVLEKAFNDYRQKGVRFVGINVQDSSDEAKDFVRKHGLSFPMVRDVELFAYRRFGVRGMPETFFLDHRYTFAGVNSGTLLGERGNIKVLGAIKAGLLEDQIELLVEQQQQGQ